MPNVCRLADDLQSIHDFLLEGYEKCPIDRLVAASTVGKCQEELRKMGRQRRIDILEAALEAAKQRAISHYDFEGSALIRDALYNKK